MISRSTDICAALKSRQRGFLLNPFRFGGGGGGGGGPTVESVAHRNLTETITTSIALTMPAGIVAGDFLVAVVRSNPITSHTSGWTKSEYNISGNLSVLYKVAAGGDALTINQSNGYKMGASTFRISGANSIQIGYGWSSGTSAPDTPAVTPSGGPRDYLGMSCVATLSGGNATTATAYPTGYGDYTRSSAPGVDSCVMHVARINQNVSTVDPSAWTLSSSIFLMWCTLAIWQS